ncbi:MAG TPA: hypothetical protein VI583_14495, partial [Cyclobacteriaceae bacterium]|nr:hypothetical protein [Cyclobacteriaceae bacterium]
MMKNKIKVPGKTVRAEYSWRIRIFPMIFMVILISVNCISQTRLFDNEWRFHHGGMQSAETPGFDDSAWRVVDLPHDWSIEDIPGTGSPFLHHAVSQVGGGYTVGGTGWYRKTFS